jgi:hypothetical protein
MIFQVQGVVHSLFLMPEILFSQNGHLLIDVPIQVNADSLPRQAIARNSLPCLVMEMSLVSMYPPGKCNGPQ